MVRKLVDLKVVVFVAVLLVCHAARAQCPPRWIEGFPSGGVVGGGVYAFARFDDDGEGPRPRELYVAGDFANAGAVGSTSRIARFDGSSWEPLGRGLGGGPRPGLIGAARSMAAFGASGGRESLYVAGDFTAAHQADGEVLSVQGRARWDGAAWRPFGEEIPGVVTALKVLDFEGDGVAGPRLYTLGYTVENGASMTVVGRWDGESWTEMGPRLPGRVHDIVVFDSDGEGPQEAGLYAGGVLAGGVVRWTAEGWAPVGSGDEVLYIYALEVFDEDREGPAPARLFAGGQFYTVGGADVLSLARWDGESWTAVGGGVYGVVEALRVFDADDGAGPALMIGGRITGAVQPGGVLLTTRRLAKWDGTEFSTPLGVLGAGSAASVVRSLFLDNDGDGAGPTLLIGGGFNALWRHSEPSWSRQAGSIARWDGEEFGPLDRGITGDWSANILPRGAIRVFDEDGPGPREPALFVAGMISHAGALNVRSIARWGGAAWSAVGDGLSEHPASELPNRAVYALEVHDADPDDGTPPKLYAAGEFTRTGSSVILNIAAWDGVAWGPLGWGIPGRVLSLASFDEDGDGPAPARLFASGEFAAAGGVPALRIARWDGTAWTAVGEGLPGTATALLPFADGEGWTGEEELWASGLLPDGVTPFTWAWNGSSWREVSPPVHALCFAIFDADGEGAQPASLFAGTPEGVRRWTGEEWVLLSGARTGGECAGAICGPVRALMVFDEDGAGPGSAALFAAGDFRRIGAPGGSGATASYIARWDGTAWSPVGSGLAGVAGTLAEPTPALFALGAFDSDGPGGDPPSVFASGRGIHGMGGVSARNIVRWGIAAGHPEIIHQPVAQTVAAGGQVSLSVAVAAGEAVAFRWRRDGAELTDGDGVAGTASAVLTIAPARLVHNGVYDCVVTALCGEAVSSPAAVEVSCAADWNGDLAVEAADIGAFLASWLASVNGGDLLSDFNHDGAVNSLDISAFLTAWIAAVGGGC